MEITVVDDRSEDWAWWRLSRFTGPMAAMTRMGEIYMTSTRSMVDNVLAAAGSSRISRLNIIDHGNPHGFQLGSDRINMQNIGTYEPTLARLNGHFTASGFVHLQHCKIGQNHALLRELSRIWGVDVHAGTGSHNPVYRVNFGDYVRCNETACVENARRPGTSAPRQYSSPWDNPRKVCCFPAGTPVQTPGGARAIESVTAGSTVWCWDARRGEPREAVVREVQTHRGDYSLYALSTGRGRLQVTGDHLFATDAGRWMPTSRLDLHEGLVDDTCNAVPLDALDAAVAQVNTVYNLRVDGCHNYFAGEAGLLVRDH